MGVNEAPQPAKADAPSEQLRTASLTAGDVWRNVAYHLVIPAGILVLLAFVVPRFMRLFEGVGEPLPLLAAFVFGLSSAVCRRPWAVLFFSAFAIALDALIFICLARCGGKAASQVWTWAVVILQFAMFLALAGGLFLSISALLRALQSQ